MKFKEFKDFKDLVRCGMEYNFYIKEMEYWISHNSDGFYLTRVEDGFTQEFKSSEELFAKGKIDGKRIEEHWDVIKKYC